jgi:hypothetical protein
METRRIQSISRVPTQLLANPVGRRAAQEIRLSLSAHQRWSEKHRSGAASRSLPVRIAALRTATSAYLRFRFSSPTPSPTRAASGNVLYLINRTPDK